MSLYPSPNASRFQLLVFPKDCFGIVPGAADEAIMHHPEKRIRVVVVDDSPATLRTICSYLGKQARVEVVATAADGSEALLLVERLQPDAVLMDVQMPGMNGLEAAALLTKQFPAIPVVILTAHDTPGLERACRDRGAFGFVNKRRLDQELPVLLHQLLQSLRPSPRLSRKKGA
jgi:CheY-like chemotaxis protein